MRFLHLLAATSLLVTVRAHAAPTSPEQHGLFDGGNFPSSASGLVTQEGLPNAISGALSKPSSSVTTIQPTDLIILLRPASDGSFTTYNITASNLLATLFAGLPTSDPGIAGQLWVSGGVVLVSQGAQ